jgi:COP9 signalosome complex subunit 2
MSYEEYDYDNQPEIDYDDEYDPYANQDQDNGINFEDMFISAEFAADPVSDYLNVIELEKDNSTGCSWSFKSYEKLCLIYLKNRNLEEFKDKFEKLFDLYEKVDEYERYETIRNITFVLHDESDKEIVIEVFNFMIEKLYDREIVRAYMDTGLQFARVLFNLGRNQDLGSLLNDLLDYMDRKELNDEIYKSIRLELIVMKIQFCNLEKNLKESKLLYLDALRLNQDLTVDARLSAIINEEGGKLHLRQKEYDLALEKFKTSFHEYQNSGNSRAVVLLKYATLSAIIARNRKNIVSEEETTPYLNDVKFKAMKDLLSAYEEMDINKINDIWSERVSKIEDDGFIIENLNEILHNIRMNYICEKLKAYRKCTLSTLEKVKFNLNFRNFA